MNWLDRIVERWYWLVDKVSPAWEVFTDIFHWIARFFTLLWRYMFMFRGILISAPVAVLAAMIIVWSREHLPEMVEITHLVLDPEAEGAVFGLFVMTTESISRNVAIGGPVALSAVCLVCTMLSKRTLYPWLISLLSLTLPVIMYCLNTYPM